MNAQRQAIRQRHRESRREAKRADVKAHNVMRLINAAPWSYRVRLKAILFGYTLLALAKRAIAPFRRTTHDRR